MKNIYSIILILLMTLVFIGSVFGQFTRKDDMKNLEMAKSMWSDKYSFHSYKSANYRIEQTLYYLDRIKDTSIYYNDRVKLEEEVLSYMAAGSEKADNIYQKWTKVASRITKLKRLLEMLSDNGFKLENTLYKDGNYYSKYELYDDDILVVFQIEYDYAYRISYQLFTYFK